MNYELTYEGFGADEDLRERLLLCGRQLVIDLGPDCPVKMSVKQIDGMVQGRVEVALPGRVVSAVVRRREPVEALSAAVATVREAVSAIRRVSNAA